MPRPIIGRAAREAAFRAKIDTTPGYGPWGDCHVWTGRKDAFGRALRFSRSDLEVHLAEHCRAHVAARA